MNKYRFWLVGLIIVALLFSSVVYAYVNNQIAAGALGQDSLTEGQPNKGGSPDEATLYLGDGENFHGKVRLAFPFGLITSDPLNNRVLVWDELPSSNLVLGQEDFSSTQANKGGSASASTLYRPNDAMADDERLIVADTENNRVLIWSEFPASSDEPADVVLGQDDFTSNFPNRGGSPGANTLNRPYAVYSDGASLYVADTDNNRVLVWIEIPEESGTPADVVLGQEDFVSNQCNRSGSAGPATLCQPKGVMALFGGVFVADTENNRVLLFTGDVEAMFVFGQEDYIGNLPNRGGEPAANTLKEPEDIFFDPFNGIMYVADTGNNRVLIWNDYDFIEDKDANIVLGQPDFIHNEENKGGSIKASSMFKPTGLAAFDDVGLFVVDAGNNRIVVFANDGSEEAETEDEDTNETVFDTFRRKVFSEYQCKWEAPGKLEWLRLTPETVGGVSGMQLTWTQYNADKIDVKIDDGSGDFPWEIIGTLNDGHEFLPNVSGSQKVKIRATNRCKEGQFSWPVSYEEYPDGWYNL